MRQHYWHWPSCSSLEVAAAAKQIVNFVVVIFVAVIDVAVIDVAAIFVAWR